MATAFGELVARANYHAAYIMDLAFPVKELARKMSNPNEDDWPRLVRVGRYLKGRPRAHL